LENQKIPIVQKLLMCLSVGPTSEIESDVASDLHTQKLYLGVFCLYLQSAVLLHDIYSIASGMVVAFLKLGLVLCVFVSTGVRE